MARFKVGDILINKHQDKNYHRLLITQVSSYYRFKFINPAFKYHEGSDDIDVIDSLWELHITQYNKYWWELNVS